MYGVWGHRRAEFIKAQGKSDVVVMKDMFTHVNKIIEASLGATHSSWLRCGL